MVDLDILWLALEDFVPVVLSAAGLWVIAKLCRVADRRAGAWAFTAFVLITTGGITKPIYKTTLALSGSQVDLVILDDMLFWFLAPGFAFLGAGVTRALSIRRGNGPKTARALFAAVAVVPVAALLAVLGSTGWFFVLLAAATVCNIWAVVVLVSWSRRRRSPLAASFFVASLVVSLGLAGAAASLEQTIPVQWGEQLASTAGQGLFLLGASHLARATVGADTR